MWSKWKRLTGLSLADAEFGTPGAVHLLLGADVFSRVVLYGRWFGPSGSPSAFKMQFGWVLAGSVCSSSQSGSCYLTVPGRTQLNYSRIPKGRAYVTRQRTSCTCNNHAPWTRRKGVSRQKFVKAVPALVGRMLVPKPFGMAGSKT